MGYHKGVVDSLSMCPPGLDDGVWNLRDINYYRRIITRNNKANLDFLMSMNETNETELLLVTPLSDAPTPAPPTPAPTPVPQDVTTKVKLGALTGTAADFANSNVVAALGFGSDVQTSIEYSVEAITILDPAPTPQQAKQAFGLLWHVLPDAVEANVDYARRLEGRRLAAGTVTASIKTTDPGVADTAKSSAA